MRQKEIPKNRHSKTGPGRILIVLMTAVIFYPATGCNDTDAPVDLGDRQTTSPDASRYTYIISDVHLGPDYSSNWYQTSVHGDYFKTVLKYIQDKKKKVGDVVILGDWFDFQVYDLNFSPDKHSKHKYAPVTLVQIIDAHPKLFKRQTGEHSGDFITLMDTISGNLHYVNGNHDYFLKVDDINKCLAAETGRKIVSSDPDPFQNIVYETDFVHAEHSHKHTLFNNTYAYDNGLNQTPAGYFIARIQADQSNYQLRQKGLDNAAQLKNFGNQAPGMAVYLFALIASLPRSSSFAGHMFQAYIDVFKNEYPITDDAEFVMPYPSKLTDTAHAPVGYYALKLETAKAKFPELFHFFDASSWGRLKRDRNSGLNAFGRNNLDKYKILIYGHTHEPYIYQKGDQQGSPVYVNSGFNCPDEVSMNATGAEKKHLTFVEIEETDRYLYVTLKAVKNASEKYEIFDYQETKLVHK